MMYRVILCGCLLLGSLPHFLYAQAPDRWTSGEIYEAIAKLRVLGTALYVAAHPDDENTRLISYLANDRKVNTTYMAMTRGGGGQDLIGPEIGELLGVIRTEELLQARKTDHGHQRFSRARDFGYSKTPEETLKIWNHDSILADVVWVIRTLQPDVIINRFGAYPQKGNHGHHVASAMLSVEAFDKAGDPNAFPEQLAYTKPWKPQRLFFNTSWWFYGSRENFEAADKHNMVKIDVGTYDPITGLSNNEIAAMSRSFHKSQGFGATPSRGSQIEYLELLKGSMPSDEHNLFENIDISWHRVPGGAPIDGMIAGVLKDFDFEAPSASVPALLAVRKAISGLGDSIWKTRKLNEINEILTQCMGLFVEADASAYQVDAGDSVDVSFEVINRSPVDAELLSVICTGGQDMGMQGTLADNEGQIVQHRVEIPAGLKSTTPYWLQTEGTLGRYVVKDLHLRGLPETPRAVFANFRVRILGDTLTFASPFVFKDTDPVRGEVYRPFEIVPPAFVNIHSAAYIFKNAEPRTIGVTVRSAKANINGMLKLNAPEGWKVTPDEIPVEISGKGNEVQYEFTVEPLDGATEGYVRAELETEGQVCNQRLDEINYNHIPAQTVLRESTAKVANVDLKCEGNPIAYIPGAGDDIPACLQQVGYHVVTLSPSDITNSTMLRAYDAVILGIRAYNTIDRIGFIQDYLFDYVKSGGTLITQYNTTADLHSQTLSPLPLKISRLRVTTEDSPVRFLDPDNPVMTTPNQLTQADFDGWVQERGLYFPESWDPAFTPLLGMSDPDEPELTGSLLVAQYGNGYFVYTGLSFFRQLPEGVPGAYRLFANLIALGKNGRS